MSDEMNDREAFEEVAFARSNALVQITEADDQIGDSVREQGIAYGVDYNNHYNFDKYPFKATSTPPAPSCGRVLAAIRAAASSSTPTRTAAW